MQRPLGLARHGVRLPAGGLRDQADQRAVARARRRAASGRWRPCWWRSTAGRPRRRTSPRRAAASRRPGRSPARTAATPSPASCTGDSRARAAPRRRPSPPTTSTADPAGTRSATRRGGGLGGRDDVARRAAGSAQPAQVLRDRLGRPGGVVRHVRRSHPAPRRGAHRLRRARHGVRADVEHAVQVEQGDVVPGGERAVAADPSRSQAAPAAAAAQVRRTGQAGVLAGPDRGPGLAQRLLVLRRAPGASRWPARAARPRPSRSPSRIRDRPSPNRA